MNRRPLVKLVVDAIGYLPKQSDRLLLLALELGTPFTTAQKKQAAALAKRCQKLLDAPHPINVIKIVTTPVEQQHEEYKAYANALGLWLLLSGKGTDADLSAYLRTTGEHFVMYARAALARKEYAVVDTLLARASSYLLAGH